MLEIEKYIKNLDTSWKNINLFLKSKKLIDQLTITTHPSLIVDWSILSKEEQMNYLETALSCLSDNFEILSKRIWEINKKEILKIYETHNRRTS